MDTLETWFHLKNGRRSFKPDPLRDRAEMFCHQTVQESMQLAIEKAFATGETIKLLLWGDWGVGKTHSLRHLSHWLSVNHETYPTLPVFCQIGDVSKNSRFSVVHSDLLDEIGLDKAVNWVHGFMERRGNVQEALAEIGTPPVLGQVFNKFLMATPGQSPPDVVTLAWAFLKGENLRKLGAPVGLPEQMTDSKDFYRVLAALGHIVATVERKQLVFLIDEAARLEAVSDVLEVERHWVNVNTMIFDQENRHFGLVYTVSGKSADDVPRALFEPQIENRLGNRRVELQNLPPDDVRAFLHALISAFVDQSAVQASAETTGTDGFDVSTYPFTRDGIERFIEYFQRSPEDSKPRDITDRLDEAGFYALKDRSRLINEDTLQKTGI